MTDVFRLRLGQILVRVYEHQLRGQPLQKARATEDYEE